MIKFTSRLAEPRSVYSHTVHGNVIAIIDHDGGRSVTNDAQNVIDDLIRQGFDLSKYRVIYRDTRGIWDQLLVDRTGHFAGFSSVNERDLSAALARLTRH
jgi:hypothetical protein